MKSLINKLNTKSNKNVFVENTIMTNIIKHCRGKRKRKIRPINGFRKKLFIPDHEISVATEHVVKTKIGTIFKNEKILEEKSVRIYEIDPYFSEHYKKIQVDNNGQKYILSRTDIYFTKYCLAVETDVKGQTDRELEFEKKKR